MPRRQLGSLSRPSGSGKPCRVSQAGLSRKRGGYCTRFNGKAERNVRVEAWQLPGTRGPFSTPAASRESPAQPAGTRSWLRGGVLGRVRVAIHRGFPWALCPGTRVARLRVRACFWGWWGGTGGPHVTDGRGRAPVHAPQTKRDGESGVIAVAGSPPWPTGVPPCGLKNVGNTFSSLQGDLGAGQCDA